MLVCVTSVKGAPGASTTALAMTLAWERPVLLAELDPDGGDLRPRLMPSLPGSHQLLNLASAEAITPREVLSQVVSLNAPEHSKVVLPGLSDPTAAPALDQVWTELTEALTTVHLCGGEPADVIADCGRLNRRTPQPVLSRADVILVVLRARLDSVGAAEPVIKRFKRSFSTPVLPVLIQHGPYSPRDVDQSLGGKSARLPFDTKNATALQTGRWGRKLDHSPLMRSTRALVSHITKKYPSHSRNPFVNGAGHHV